MEKLVEFEELNSYFKGKKVLLTGHTGFKGAWMLLMLKNLGAEIFGISLPARENSLYDLIGGDKLCVSHEQDINDFGLIAETVSDIEPDIVVHMAAQALVLSAYDEPLFTFSTNTIGTAHILESLRQINKQSDVLIVTTDKVYENDEKGRPFIEDDKLGGIDPYSASKACAELVAASYYQSFFKKDNQVRLVTARAGNVIGGGDNSENRLIPDIVKAITSDQELLLRNPTSTRPWQHVLDVNNGYLRLLMYLQKNNINGTSWNFGPQNSEVMTTEDITKRAIELWGKGRYKPVINQSALHEHKRLALDSSKAKEFLGWQNKLSVERSIDDTINWYKRKFSGEDPLKLTNDAINEYFE